MKESETKPEAPDRQGPMAGVKVVDLSNFIFGPLATQWLGDLGAEVIKIEPPEGDPTRGIGQSRNPRMGSFFLNLNRNKRSVVLDLKQPWDRQALDRLIGTADVLVHNMRPSAERKLGLDYATLGPKHPRLIHAVALGFGEGGAYSDRPAYDDVIQGLSGLAGLQAQVTGTPGTGTPGYIPTMIADKLCGMAMSAAISAALYHRARTGRGQSVQVPMLETTTAFVLHEHLADAALLPAAPGQPEPPMGYARALSPFHRPLPTSDGFLCVVANTDAQWKRLLELIGRPECSSDPRFSSIGARMANLSALYTILEQALASRSSADWLAAMERADIPASPVHSLQALRTDPHLVSTRFFQTLEHDSEGTLLTTAIPSRFSDSPPSIRHGAPRLGQHTDAVLRSLGFDDSEIDSRGAPTG